MTTAHFRLYKHFPTIPDSYALLALLHMHTVAFKTQFQRGVDYGKAGREPNRLEVWIETSDYQRVKQLESALTHEQVRKLAEDYETIMRSRDSNEL